MPNTASPTTTLTSIVSTLGGPRVNPIDIEWANDFTAGKLLINWLVAQLGPETVDGKDDCGIQHRVALRDVALEDDELKIFAHVKDGIDSNGADVMAPIGYLPPSHLKKRAEYMNNETELLQRESGDLKARLAQAKKASQKMAQTLKTLQSTIKGINSQIEAKTEVLAELSLKADDTIASTKSRALVLLDTVAPSNHNSSVCMEIQNTNGDVTPIATQYNTTASQPQPSIIETATSSLTSLADTRTTIIEDLSHYQDTDTRKKLPEIEELQCEAQRLKTAIENLKASPDRADSAFLDELETLCKQLESGEAGIPDGFEGVKNDEEVEEVDFYAELEKAWALDQVAALQTRSDALDEALTSLTPRILVPLENLHESLSASTSHVREAEVLLRALGEELVDLLEDVDVNTRRENMVQDGVAEDDDSIMERELVKLFKELRDLRTPDAPPLVVLNRADVLAELENLVDRGHTLQEEDERWLQERILPSLAALPQHHRPLLSAIYAHSPMNTSLPFTFPKPIEELRDNGSVKAEELQSAVVRLQKESEETLLNADGRTKRRLGGFIDKWVPK